MSTTIPCGPPVGALVGACTIRECTAVRVVDVSSAGMHWEKRELAPEERSVVAGVPCPEHVPTIHAQCPKCKCRLVNDTWETTPPPAVVHVDPALPPRLCDVCSPPVPFLDRVLGQIMEDQAFADEGCC